MKLTRFTPTPDAPDTSEPIDLDEVALPTAVPALRKPKHGRRVALALFTVLLVVPLLVGIAAIAKTSAIEIPEPTSVSDVTPYVEDMAASALDLWLNGDDTKAVALPGVNIDPYKGTTSITVLSHSRFDRIDVVGALSTRLLELNEFLLRDSDGNLFDAIVSMEVKASVPGQEYGLLISAPSLLPRTTAAGPTGSFSWCDIAECVSANTTQREAIDRALRAIYGPIEGSDIRFQDATGSARVFESVASLNFVEGSTSITSAYVRPSDGFMVATVEFRLTPVGTDEFYTSSLEFVVSETTTTGYAYTTAWGPVGAGSGLAHYANEVPTALEAS